jgi:hypothetical protein
MTTGQKKQANNNNHVKQIFPHDRPPSDRNTEPKPILVIDSDMPPRQALQLDIKKPDYQNKTFGSPAIF